MSNQTTNTTPETAVDTQLPSVEARVRPVTPKNNLIAFASIKIADCFAVNDIPVKSGKNGIYFDNPTKPDGKGGYKDICLPTTGEFRQHITAAIADAFDRAVEKLQAMGEAQREFTEKPSFKEQLSNGKKAAAEHNAAIPQAADAPKRADVAI